MSGHMYSHKQLLQGDDSTGVVLGAETPGNGTPMNVAGLSKLGIQVVFSALASTSVSPSSSASISPSGSASPSASASISPSGSASISPSASLSPSKSASISPSSSVSPSSSPSAVSGASGTVDFEASIDGTTWDALPAVPIRGGTAVLNTTGPGIWIASVAGLSLVRCRLADLVNGSVTVYGLGTTAH